MFRDIFKMSDTKSGNHVLCHNLSSKAVSHKIGVYTYVSGAKNSIMPIKNVSVLWKIYEQLFKRIFRAFLVIFSVNP